MPYMEIIAGCSEIQTNTLCGQNVELLNVKLGGTYNDHRALKCKLCYISSPYRAVNTLHLGFQNQSVKAV